jgi:hypothetical protein
MVIDGHLPISFENGPLKIKAMKYSHNCKIGWKTRIIRLDGSYRMSMEPTDLRRGTAIRSAQESR